MRSLLFTPANRPELIRKLPGYGADAFAIDLEDGTPEAQKTLARETLGGSVADLRGRGFERPLFVRVNDSRSAHFQPDLTAALEAGVDGIILPKLEAAADLEAVSEPFDRAEQHRGRKMDLIALIETPLGVAMVEELVLGGASGPDALIFGAEDFVTEMRGRRTEQGFEVLYARSRVVLAARAAGIGAIDQACVAVRADAEFRRDAELGRELGYEGKLCLGPRQVDIANEVFSPSRTEIERSRRILEAHERAESEGRGVIAFEGRMVDEPILRRARAIVALAARLEQDEEDGLEDE